MPTHPRGSPWYYLWTVKFINKSLFYPSLAIQHYLILPNRSLDLQISQFSVTWQNPPSERSEAKLSGRREERDNTPHTLSQDNHHVCVGVPDWRRQDGVKSVCAWLFILVVNKKGRVSMLYFFQYSAYFNGESEMVQREKWIWIHYKVNILCWFTF